MLQTSGVNNLHLTAPGFAKGFCVDEDPALRTAVPHTHKYFEPQAHERAHIWSTEKRQEKESKAKSTTPNPPKSESRAVPVL